jgi:hypothetical protein
MTDRDEEYSAQETNRRFEAALRGDPPPSTKSMTRVLNSPGYGLCIG